MNLMDDFFSLLFPRTCFACGNSLFKNEKVVCLSCLYHLPKTNFHKDKDNPASKTFWGRVNLEAATAMYFYKKGGKVQQLIHQLKYKGHQEIGIYLGELYGTELRACDIFNSIDLIVPIPLHPRKLKKRGFNQAEQFAKGLGKTMGVEVDSRSLIRNIDTYTQTKKSRYKRWENVSDIFFLRNPEKFGGKHILVVDDVITTGATMEACALTIKKLEDVKVSVASMAYASH
jgi:ComF family protein